MSEIKSMLTRSDLAELTICDDGEQITIIVPAHIAEKWTEGRGRTITLGDALNEMLNDMKEIHGARHGTN